MTFYLVTERGRQLKLTSVAVLPSYTIESDLALGILIRNIMCIQLFAEGSHEPTFSTIIFCSSCVRSRAGLRTRYRARRRPCWGPCCRVDGHTRGCRLAQARIPELPWTFASLLCTTPCLGEPCLMCAGVPAACTGGSAGGQAAGALDGARAAPAPGVRAPLPPGPGGAQAQGARHYLGCGVRARSCAGFGSAQVKAFGAPLQCWQYGMRQYGVRQ